MMTFALPWTLGQAVARVGGRLLGADGDFRGIGIDSRQDLSGRLFVALTGERQDGHDFAASARDQGAAALMVQRPLAIDLPQWQVADTRLALGQLAAAHRDRFAGRVVALTGSNGNTTTQEMHAAIPGPGGRLRGECPRARLAGNPAVVGRPKGPLDRKLCVPTFRWVCPVSEACAAGFSLGGEPPTETAPEP